MIDDSALPGVPQQLRAQASTLSSKKTGAHICRKAQAASRLELLASEAELMMLFLQQPAMIRSQEKIQQVHPHAGTGKLAH